MEHTVIKRALNRVLLSFFLVFIRQEESQCKSSPGTCTFNEVCEKFSAIFEKRCHVVGAKRW